MINKLKLEDFINYITKDKNLIFFVGSAISIYPPTNLLTGNELNINFFESLTYNDKFLLKYRDEFESIINSDREFGKIPLERTISYINSFYPKDSSRILTDYLGYFKYVQPNLIHKVLLKLSDEKKEKIIFTTNFDCAFENIKDQFIQKIIITNKNIDDFNKKDYKNHIKIIKLHGSIDNIETLILTLERESKGLNPNLQDIMKKILENKSICFIGYGASDFDIFPIFSEINFKKIFCLFKPPEIDINKTRIGFLLEKKDSYICFGNISELFNKIINNKNYNLDKIECIEPVEKRSISNLNLYFKENIPLLRYLIIIKIFLILLKFNEAKRIMRISLRKAKYMKRRLKGKIDNELEIYFKNYYLILGSIYNQKGNLIRAYLVFKKNLKYCKKNYNNDVYNLYNAKLYIICSLIMLRKLKKAKREIEELEKEVDNNIELSTDKKNKLKADLLDYKIKIEEIEYTIKPFNNTKYFNEKELLKLRKKYEDEGNIDKIHDCDFYLYRLEFYNNKQKQKELESLIKKYAELCNKFKLSGNIMSYINALRDRSNVLINLKRYNEVIEIHNYILEVFKEHGKDYQTGFKSCAYLSYAYFKLHDYKNFLIYLLKYFKYNIFHFLFTPIFIIVNFRRFFKFK